MSQGRLKRDWEQTAAIAWAAFHAFRGKETRLDVDSFNPMSDKPKRSGIPLTPDVLLSMKPRITGHK